MFRWARGMPGKHAGKGLEVGLQSEITTLDQERKFMAGQAGFRARRSSFCAQVPSVCCIQILEYLEGALEIGLPAICIEVAKPHQRHSRADQEKRQSKSVQRPAVDNLHPKGLLGAPLAGWPQ